MNPFQLHIMSVFDVLNMVDEAEAQKAIEILRNARNRGSNVWLAGNGGSASNASHFANDLVKICHIKAICLNELVSTTTAYGNDHGWERMYANAAQLLQKSLDVLVLFSCSGNSLNIVHLAREFGNVGDIILFTGLGDGKLPKEGPWSAMLKVMHDDIAVQESAHSVLCHAIVRSLQ